MDRVRIDDLQYERAGSDYLGDRWSCHVRLIPNPAYRWKVGSTVIMERSDGTTFPVRVQPNRLTTAPYAGCNFFVEV